MLNVWVHIAKLACATSKSSFCMAVEARIVLHLGTVWGCAAVVVLNSQKGRPAQNPSILRAFSSANLFFKESNPTHKWPITWASEANLFPEKRTVIQLFCNGLGLSNHQIHSCRHDRIYPTKCLFDCKEWFFKHVLKEKEMFSWEVAFSDNNGEWLNKSK